MKLISENMVVVGNEEYEAVPAHSVFSCEGCSFRDKDIGGCNIVGDKFCEPGVRSDEKSIVWVKKDSAPQSVEVSKKRPHFDMIIAWANGAEIEYFCAGENEWYHIDCPAWDEKTLYRIKQKDIVHQVHITPDGGISTTSPANIQVTFDAHTGCIKSANIL